ncbi:MAG: nicotinate (nicotinamide) nucleotide adenylyltransferase [Crocinitomicaceae bacterium]
MSDNIVSNLISTFDSNPKGAEKTIGLFFGSFNPIHTGHLILANHFANYTNLDEVWFVVSPHNPHKKKASLLDENHRLAMVNEAIDDNIKLKASNIEFEMPKPSYTVDTLAYLKEKHPTYQFALIMGEDNLRSFHKWKNFEVILEKYPIFIYPRVYTVQELEAQSKEENNKLQNHPSIQLIDAPLMKISSSFIRNAIKDKKDIRYLVSEPVFKYLDEMNFYR